MKKIGIIICSRYQSCGGGKCLRALRERVGAFSIYTPEEEVELVGYSNCGGCPGGNIEYVPEEMIKNGAETIHLATGFVVGYPPCPYIKEFKEFIKSRYEANVVVGTHPIPIKYYNEHKKLSYWEKMNMTEIAADLFHDDESIMKDYNVGCAVCINKFDVNEDTANEIESYCIDLSVPVIGRIPYDGTVVKAVNRCQSIACYPDSPAGKAIASIWEKIYNSYLRG